MLETYKETTICIPVDTTEDSVKLVVNFSSGISVPGGMDLEALHGWILKSGKDRKILYSSVENCVIWIENKSPPWAAYHAFISDHLIALDKNPGACPVRVGETW